MKNIKFTLFLLASLLSATASSQMPKVAIISFDANEKAFESFAFTELIRIELAKHNKYEVLDRYEVGDKLKNNNIDAFSCFSKSCLVHAGKKLEVEYIVSGSLDHIGESMFLRIRLLNVNAGILEKEVVKEFLFIPEKVATMLTLCINDLVGVPNDVNVEQSLTNIESYESALNNPNYNRLNLSGPRMGYAFFVGENAKIMKMPRNDGGYEAYPAMFQMGYQMEQQYLNEGKWQALFEFIPMISGIDQGLFIPSMTIMNGLRNNETGFEIGLGPTLVSSRQSKMFQDPNGNWHKVDSEPNLFDAPEVNRLDSRGQVRLVSNVVIAAGYTFRSGKLNIPINLFVVPSKNNMRFGFSFGFNARK